MQKSWAFTVRMKNTNNRDMDCFHPLTTATPPPAAMLSPFGYEPHALCREAAHEVMDYVMRHPQLLEDAQRGKMMGVLVGEQKGRLGFLAAYSGLLAGRNDWPWFVPSVFDAQQPDGHFKQEERAISQINRDIAALEQSEEMALARQHLQNVRQETEEMVEMMKNRTAEAKAMRDMIRMQRNIDAQEHAALVRESQFMKAELHRTKKHAEERLNAALARVGQLEDRLKAMKEERRQRSDALQRWLFSHYILKNARGEERNLLEIFPQTQLPPSGSGDCCAPKLLQHAYTTGLRPLCLAEFWWGESPRGEVRHHLHFYPPCRSKCVPILGWMMQGLDVEQTTLRSPDDTALEVVYEDDWLAVVVKPAGMLSIPGKIDRPSVEETMRQRWHDDVNPLIVHRLDMETSGLMVVARTKWAHAELQRQFLERTVSKEYVAVVEGTVSGSGTISLPLRPDLDDRPRQLVDHQNGREAVTHYDTLSTDGRRTRLLLTPKTGRTHQLRVHCAHREGLSAPIVGDELYGSMQPVGPDVATDSRPGRLLLHAATLCFVHPKTQKEMTFRSEPPF